MGYTKAQRIRNEKDAARKLTEYNKLMQPVWQKQRKEQTERIITIGMLLGADWIPMHRMFVKRDNREYQGIATYWETFYNEMGEEIPRPKGWK